MQKQKTGLLPTVKEWQFSSTTVVLIVPGNLFASSKQVRKSNQRQEVFSLWSNKVKLIVRQMSSAHTLPIELYETAETQTAVLVNASLTTPASAPHNGHTLIALAVIACIANASWTVTGFGAGIVFQIGWQIAYIIGGTVM
jgi:hypothetical protein